MTTITEDNQKSQKNKWISKILLGTFILLIFLNLPTLCQAHDHDEPPSFKYSEKANSRQMQDDLGVSKVIDHHTHGHNDHDHNHDHQEKSVLSDEAYKEVIVKAVTSTLIISAAPFFVLFLVPLDNTKECESVLKILLSFASGGLLGDAFLHLIPHALVPYVHESEEAHSHTHSHDHDNEEVNHVHDISVGLCVLLGIVVFLIVEKAVRIIKTDHSHVHVHNVKENKNNKSQKSSKEKEPKKPENEIKIAGYLNLVADFLHNFTDGLAIGASYLAGKNIGYITTFTILLHEVPHEIGDFAILIQSGYSKRKAMMLQLTTAIGALLGTYVSLLAEGMGDIATKWILPFTAGGFIYIATVSVIPELLTDTNFRQSVKEIIALLFGVYMMVLIAKYE